MASNIPNPINSCPPRFIGAVFGLTFFGIGLTVLGFLWLSNGVDSPPLVFRLFGSFISLGFVAMGGGLAFASIFGRANSLNFVAAQAISLHSQLPQTVSGSYTCPHCAAPLQSVADVSPSGDVKCSFCNSWFNVHQQKA